MTDTVRLGLMPPLTGVVSMYGAEIVRAARIACEEVNEQGGVGGRPLEIVVEDDGSLPESAVDAAEKLLKQHKCMAIVGNLLSNSRIAVAYRVAEPRKTPYLNFSFYEGSILSRYFFHFAALPNQQIDRMIPYMLKTHGGRMFFAGNNYEWPRGSIAAAKRSLEAAGGKVAGEEYFPLGVDDAAIDSLLDRVAGAAPDVFVPYFAGADQLRLLTHFAGRGLKKRIVVVMGHYDEMMASSLPPDVREGLYSSNTYFMTVDTAANRSFMDRLAAYPGVTGIWPHGNGIMTNFGEGAYICVKAFARAANDAGSLNPAALIGALRTVTIEAPQGLVHMEPETQHAMVNTYLSRCAADGTFTIVERFGAIAPALPDRYHHQRIGARTTLEEDMRLQARMLAHLSEAVLLIRAEDSTIVYNNAGAEKMFGYSGTELIGMPISRLDAPSGHGPVHSSVEMIRELAGKGEWRGEIASVRKDGALIWREVSASAFTHPFFGEVWLAVCRDITDSKRAENAIAESRAAFTALAEVSPVGIFHTDPAGAYLTVNRRWTEITGLNNEEARENGWTQSLHPDDRDRVVREWTEWTRRGRAFRSEYRFKRPDGNVSWVIGEARAQHDSKGALTGYIGAITDITSQRQYRAALEDLSTLRRAAGDDYFSQAAANLAESLGVEIGFVNTLKHDGSWVHTKGLFVDGHVQPLTEWALAGTPCERAIHGRATVVPRDLRHHFPAFSISIALGANSYAAMPMIDSENKIVGSVGVMSRNSLDNSESMLAILTLFATQVAVELERRRTEAWFIGVFEFAPDAVVISDRKGRIQRVNRAAEEMFGWTRAELDGQAVEVLMPQAMRRQHVGLRGQFMLAGTNRAMGAGRLSLRGLRKNGAEFPVEIGLAPIETEDGLLVAASVRDVSTRMVLEGQFRQAQKMESVGQLAAGIAHDFNNLLTIVNGLAELASTEIPKDSPVQERLASILNAGERAAALTRQLLAFSRKQILRPSVVNLNEVVSEAETLLRRALGEQIRLVVEMETDLSNVTVDPEQFQQVILNLALNSRDAMPKGGTLTIRTANVAFDETTRIPRPGFPPGRYVMLTLTDTGIGMDEATQALIFEPFFTTKPKGQGTGLGLATVYGIVKQSGGDIYVWSKAGEGTAFTIYVPVSDVEADGDRAKEAPLAAHGTEHVLVVDDDANLRDVVKWMLGHAGYKVIAAGSAEEALQLLNDGDVPIHLLLTDVVMPGMGGWELAERVQALRPEIRILFMSGYSEEGPLRTGVSDKSVHLINKPYSIGDLTRKIREVLES